MDESLQYVNLTNAEVGSVPAPGQGDVNVTAPVQGQRQEGVLYVQQEGVMQTPAGEQYVTIIQDGQTYAIPAADYAAMMAQQNIEDPNKDVKDQKSSTDNISMQESPVRKVETQSGVPQSSIATDTKLPTPAASTVAVKSNVKPANSIRSNVKKTSPPVLAPKQPRIFTSENPRKHLYPTIQEVIQKLPESAAAPKKNYKPIRVDNWGIFLLSRLQNYFQKKEYCDLTLRFPTKNAQIKVHKLILNACTDYFNHFEKEGKIVDNALDMPANFTPEAVAPIIRFMYTGKIELKEQSYEKLYQTAETLQMGVLTKLMDAQVNTPDVEPSSGVRKPVKRNNTGAFEEDPVEQMRKIKRIEKRVAMEGRKTIKNEVELPKIPGKKLPIWKRKISNEIPIAPKSTLPTVKASASENFSGYKIPKVSENAAESVTDMMNQTIEKSREEDDEGTHHIRIEPDSGQLIASPLVGTTYKRRSPGEKPKIPRRLQEIQQHLMFEKVLKSGTKNTVMKKEVDSDKSRELSIDEVKELMEEQKQRLAAISQDEAEEENDEYDYNEDALGIGDDYIDNVDSPAPGNNTEGEEDPGDCGKTICKDRSNPHPDTIEPEISVPSQNYLQMQDINSGGSDAVHPETLKNVPFIQVAEQHNSKTFDTEVKQTDNETSTHSLQLGQCAVAKKTQVEVQTSRNELDEALEEFSRVAEEEAAEEFNNLEDKFSAPPVLAKPKTENITPDPKKPRRGRPPRWLKEQTLQMGLKKLNQENSQSLSIDLKKEEGIASVPESNVKQEQNQNQLINEVIKKYPNLFKENKAVKIKILTKDTSGKSVTKFITLKAQAENQQISEPEEQPVSPVPVASGGFKPVQKVMYTGKRGRPKKVKPGEFDPHHEERKKIEARLKRDYPQLASQLTNKVENIDEDDPDNEIDDDPITEDLDEVIQNESAEASGTNPHSIDASSNLESEALENVVIPPTNIQGGVTSMHPGISMSNSSQHGEMLAQVQPTTSSLPQYQPIPGQAYVMDNGQIHIVTGASPLVNLDPAQSHQGEMIQILTSDGQMQFAMPKNKINTANLSIPQSLQMNPQQTFINSAGIMSMNTVTRNLAPAPAQLVNMSNIGDLSSVDTGSTTGLVMAPTMMTLAPTVTYTTNAAQGHGTAMIPVTGDILQSVAATHQTFSQHSENNSEAARVVNKIVTDWESDEENHN